MPTYENVSDPNQGYMVKNIYDRERAVMQGDTIETYEDLSGNSDFSETSASPTNTVTITAQNTWTDGVRMKWRENRLNLSVSGVTDSTVTLQRSEDGGTTWLDVQQFTANAETFIEDAGDDTLYRVGVKTGEYGTDTVVVLLGK